MPIHKHHVDPGAEKFVLDWHQREDERQIRRDIRFSRQEDVGWAESIRDGIWVSYAMIYKICSWNEFCAFQTLSKLSFQLQDKSHETCCCLRRAPINSWIQMPGFQSLPITNCPTD
jgi:hypothetical protein